MTAPPATPAALGELEFLRAEVERLRESERRLSLVFDGVADLLFVIDVDEDETYRHVAVNEAYLRAREMRAEDIVGHPLREVLSPDEAATALEHNREAIARRSSLTFREVVEFGGRSVALHTTLSPIFDDDGVCRTLIGVARDVSEEESLAEQLRQAQKMEAVGRLAGGVAHDFNNLLTAITGYAELAHARLSPDDPVSRDVLEIQAAATRAAALTRQLLTFSRLDVNQPRVVDLAAAATSVERMLKRLMEARIELVCSAGPAAALIDPAQLEQVILNLALNARDAMPAGGRLTIATDTVQTPEGAFARLVVTDEGTGMDADTRSRAFEPFFTTKEQGKGTGLGLSTAYGIVQEAGGRIDLASEPGAGTRVTILLPAAHAEHTPAGPDDAEAPRGRCTGRILLVEDQDVVRELARRVLEERGYAVVAARNGVEALELADLDDLDDVDLLLTDIAMPKMGGRELARRVHEAAPHVRVLFMSGFAEEAGPTEGTPLLQKPFTLDMLALAVEAALAAA